MATASNSIDNNGGSGCGRGAEGRLLGAPFPPRPKAIATFLSSSDFLKGCQTVLHSARRHLAPTPKDKYPPEFIVLLSSKVPNPAAKEDFLYPTFCDRIIKVGHIPIAKDSNESNSNEKPSHVKSWDENCGWTKLRLFELDSYDAILYIDADCLVVKDVGHLLNIDEPTVKSKVDDAINTKRTGLLAAAPDIFPPDKFNAGVMVLRPSKAVFEEMMARLPNSESNQNGTAKSCTSYDGGDTGFLNSFYPGWYSDMPSYSRLSFGYNAQRFMHHCTYEKQPKYWDEGIEDIRIIHFSSSPKPWEKTKSSTEKTEKQSFLAKKDTDKLEMAKHGKLENLWQAAYERSQKYFVDELQKRVPARRNTPPQKSPPPASAVAAARGPPKPSAPPRRARPQSDPHSMVQKRYKELRKTGMSTKDAMTAARADYGLDRADDVTDPGQAVGRMFGLM